MKRTIAIIFLLTMTSCQFFQNKENKENKQEEVFLTSDNEEATLLEKYAFVTDRNGGFIRVTANENAPIVDTLHYGSSLEISAETASFYKIKDVENYILKKQVGEEVLLIPSDLNLILDIQEGETEENSEENNYEFFETPQPLNDFITLELVSKNEYLTEMQNSIDFILRDTLAIQKKNGVIVLPCENENTVIFQDFENDEDINMRTYGYIGQIEELDQYVLSGSYYEAWDAILIDKKTGLAKHILDYPHISPDKKHMVCVTLNPYEGTTEFSLYSINENGINKIVQTSFVRWALQEYEENKVFFSKNGYLYLPAIYESLSGIDSDKITMQYIKIGIK
ncbi:MAG: hypothetical protein Q3983_04845 [Capnocytophaga sp.]|nr:hypothetical protein [Capnocytophaga sp.]